MDMGPLYKTQPNPNQPKPTLLQRNPTDDCNYSSADPTQPNPTLPNIGHTSDQKSKPIFYHNYII